MHRGRTDVASAEPAPSRRAGVILAGGGMLFISLDSLFTRAADVSGWTVTFWLGLFMAATMLCWQVIGEGVGPVAQLRRDGWPLVLSGLFQALSTTCFVLAVKRTLIANVVVIIAAAPLFAAVISWLAIRERTSRRVLAAIAASLVGMLVVVSGSIGAGSLDGDLLAFGAIAAFGANLTVWRRHPRQSRPLAMALGGSIMAAIAAVPADLSGHDLETLAYLFLMGAVTGPLGRLGVATATRHLPAAEVGLFAPVETVAATFWAWLAFSESPSSTTVVGGVIVIAAVLWGTRPTAAVTRVTP